VYVLFLLFITGCCTNSFDTSSCYYGIIVASQSLHRQIIWQQFDFKFSQAFSNGLFQTATLPYCSPVLSFFNQAATDVEVTDIFITLYRVAADSHIVNALIKPGL
jgi:hypothetical protein